MPRTEQFISEPITPVPGTTDTARMAVGEPALPGRFTWRGEQYAVLEVLAIWKQAGPSKGGQGSIYLRKHWYRVKTDAGIEMTVYFQRQPASRARAKDRWYLYSIVPAE